MEKCLVIILAFLMVNSNLTIFSMHERYYGKVGGTVPIKVMIKNKMDKTVNLNLTFLSKPSINNYYVKVVIHPNIVNLNIKPHDIVVLEINVTASAAIYTDIYARWGENEIRLCRVYFYTGEKPSIEHLRAYSITVFCISISIYFALWLWRRVYLVRKYE